MKRHPLHSMEFITNCLVVTGCYPGQRRTGRSTALALRLISESIKRPGEWLSIKDHHDSRMADHHLRQMIQDIVLKLGLEGFTFREDKIGFGITD